MTFVPLARPAELQLLSHGRLCVFQFAQAMLRALVATMGTVAMEFWALEDVFAAKASEEVPAICVLLVTTAATAQVAGSKHGLADPHLTSSSFVSDLNSLSPEARRSGDRRVTGQEVASPK